MYIYNVEYLNFSVAITPAVTATLVKKGFNVNLETNAGFEAKFRDNDYINAGAKIVNSKNIYNSDILLKVRQPTESEIPMIKDGSTLISFLYPGQNKELIDKLAQKKINAFAMDCIPRISRAQVFDALSSMANIAGYRAVIEAANYFPRFFTGKLNFLILKNKISLKKYYFLRTNYCCWKSTACKDSCNWWWCCWFSRYWSST